MGQSEAEVGKRGSWEGRKDRRLKVEKIKRWITDYG
jgi:hypothetical protein